MFVSSSSSSSHLFLPVARVPRPLGNVRQAVLDAGADVGEAVADGAADAAGQTVDRLAKAASGATYDAADGVAHARDGVAQDAGLEEVAVVSVSVVLPKRRVRLGGGRSGEVDGVGV